THPAAALELHQRHQIDAGAVHARAGLRERAVARPLPSLRPHEFVVEGRVVRLPVEVRDASTMFATFVVPSAAARRLFPQTEIQLAEIFPGRGLMSVAAVDYRDNDLGRYNELAVAFPVRVGRGRPWPIVGMALDFARGRG